MANEGSVRNWLVNEYGDRDFNQLCQALMWQLCNRFGSAPVSYASAIDAWYASPTNGSGVGPPGSFTYYDIGAYGHVDWVMDSGNAVMGSTRVTENWGWTNRGPKNGWDYAAQTGATILGWSWVNGANTCPYDGGGGGTVDYAFGLTTECQAALQNAMSVNGPPYYSGPQDGVFGENSVKGMQQWLKDLGYLPGDYVVDGIPGPTYGTALQELARDRGVPPYTGPIDGAPGNNTSISLIGWAQTTLSPDPGPGPGPGIPNVPAGTTFGVDVGTSQQGFDFAAFVAGGGTGAIVKMGGGNASDSPYVSPHYVEQIRDARAAGIAVGHYWFNGAQNGLTPEASADFYAEHMELQSGDLIALDVEDETATGTTAYTSAQAHAFANRLRTILGPELAIGIYANDSVWGRGDWSWIEADGHWRWPAKWGSNSGEPETAPPDPWAIWQFTSNAGPVPGWASESLDGNAIRDGVWAQYRYEPYDPGPDPEPDPEPGIDQPLRDLTAAYFGEIAELNARYAELATELPTPEPEAASADADPAPARHRFRPI